MSLQTRGGRIHSLLRSTQRTIAPYVTQRNLVRASAAAGAVYRQYRAARQGRAQNVTQGSAPLTGQFDYKTDYSKRRKSRRQRRIGRRRYKQKRRIINTVKNSTVAPVHLVRRSMFQLTSATQQSNAVCYGLYGINGVSNDSFNTTDDVASIFKQMDPTGWADANDPLDHSRNQKVWFLHGTLEMTIRNTGNQDALIEAYYIRGRKSVNAAWGSPTDLYSAGFRKQNLAKNPEEPRTTFERHLEVTDVGVTPFQNALFCQSYNIYKRQKFRIPPGGEINFVITDRRSRTFSMVPSQRIATDKRYHGVLFQQQGSPDASAEPATVALPTAVTYLATRRYRFKMLRDALATDAWDTAATTHGLENPAPGV